MYWGNLSTLSEGVKKRLLLKRQAALDDMEQHLETRG